MANAYAQLNKIEEMDDSIDLCLQLALKSDKDSHKIFGLAFCAKALQAIEKYDKAEPLIKEAYALNQKSRIGIVMPDILSIYGENMTQQGDYFKAFFLFENLINITSQNGNQANRALHLSLQANAYHLFGTSNIAIRLLMTAIDTANQQGNLYQEAYASYTISKIYFDLCDYNNGELYFIHGMRIASQINADLLINKLNVLVRRHAHHFSSKTV